MPDLSSGDLVQRVRDQLDYHPYETTSTTTAAGTQGVASTVVVPDTTRWSENDVLEWQTGTVGWEQVLIRSITNGTDMVGVRGSYGTTAEAHTSGDRVVQLDKQGFSGRLIQQMITQALLDMWPFVWKTGTKDLTFATTTKWYDLDALTLGIVRIDQQLNSTVLDFRRFKDRYYGDGKTYVVRRGIPTAVAASANAVMFPDGVYDTRDPGANLIKVTDVRAITGTTDIADSTILPVADAVVHGVIARLLRAKEITRVQYGQPMETIQTTSPGDKLQVSSWFDREYRARIEAIRTRLDELYDPDTVWGV